MRPGLRCEGRSRARSGSGDVAYDRCFGSVEEWTERDDLRACVRDNALVIAGRCPRCWHEMDDFVSLSPAWLSELRRRGGRPKIKTVTACNCDDRHDGRPDGEHGCGAIAVLTVKLTAVRAQPPRKRAVTAGIAKARPATARDRSWDEEADRWDQTKTDTISTVAERWGATVGALFGLIGFSLVLSGDQVTKAVTSNVTWPWWVLAGVLAGACFACLYGWRRRDPDEPADPLMIAACAVSAAAAIVAISWGAFRSVPVDAGPTFGIIAGIAVLFAMAATGFAGLAAQGSPRWVNYLTGNRMRTLRMESADSSSRNLRRARVATVVGIGALVATLAVLWYAPAAKPGPQQVLVRQTTGAGDVCGALQPNSGRGLAIVPDGDTRPRTIQTDEIAGVEAVDSCSRR